MSVIFTGIFFQEDVFECLRDKIPFHKNDVANGSGYHITCCYRPSDDQLFPKEMVGKEVEVVVTHIMRGEGITAVAVELPEFVKAYYWGQPKIHVTLGFDRPRKPVDAGKIPIDKWEAITPFIIKGKIGYFNG